MILSIIVGIIILLIILLIGVSYVKAPPDVAYIISGLSKKPRIIIGRATLRLPFFERIDKLPLELIPVDIKVTKVPSLDFININADAAANIQISKEPELIEKAIQNFLNLTSSDIRDIARETLESNTREIIGQMELKSFVNKKDEFSKKVQENVVSDMEQMGLRIVNFNVQNFNDDNNAIENLGIDNLAKIQKDAAISKANAERDVKIAQAKADEEGAKARAEADAKIAEQNKILSIKKSQFKKEQDIQQAQADAAYEIQEQEQQKAINEAQVSADIAKREKEAELKEKEILLKERELDATIKKQADAEKYQKEKQAEAAKFIEQQKAEAELFKTQKQAEAQKAEAEARRFAAEQEAIGIKAKLLAEADGIKAKGLAEAQAIEKKAEAQKKMEKASIAEMYFNVLPLVAEKVAQPLSNIGEITMYGEGNTTKLIEEITRNVQQVQKGVADGVGLDLTELLTDFVQNIGKKKVEVNKHE